MSYLERLQKRLGVEIIRREEVKGEPDLENVVVKVKDKEFKIRVEKSVIENKENR